MAIVWNLGLTFGNPGMNVLFNAMGGQYLPANPTIFHMKEGENLVTFHGTFVTNNGQLISGTITSFDVYYDNLRTI